jgi:hypothetical protein
MTEMTIKKPRQSRAVEKTTAEVDLVAGRPSDKPKPTVIKLGEKERLNSYVTPEQKLKLRLLAVAKGCSISEVVGVLIDETPKPEF